ncbi:MAG TPA: hypothetical protein VFX61_08915 [Micromonosporaceae bacterium]|nr:hypothetical protein [Micromonosporaceae bacterium]
MPRTAPAVTSLLAAVVLLVGCGVPPELREPSPRSQTASPQPTEGPPATFTPAPLVPTTGPAATPTFSELTAADCQGRPTGAQVIELLRRDKVLARDVRVTIDSLPVCAGTWQYTVVQVPGHEPLQVVSEGPPTALKLVTAGTDVCSIPVRTAAPPGIRNLAC